MCTLAARGPSPMRTWPRWVSPILTPGASGIRNEAGMPVPLTPTRLGLSPRALADACASGGLTAGGPPSGVAARPCTGDAEKPFDFGGRPLTVPGRATPPLAIVRGFQDTTA